MENIVSVDYELEWKIILQEGNFKIEYKDSSGATYRIEFYDPSGNLLSSEAV